MSSGVRLLGAPPGISTAGDLCFSVDGTHHAYVDLYEAWKLYCDEIKDSEHEDFLNNDLVPCLLNNDDLSDLYKEIAKRTVPTIAGAIRELVQATCDKGGGGEQSSCRHGWCAV